MGNIRSKLLFPPEGTFNPVKQLVKCIGKLINFIGSISKLDALGKILVCLNFLYRIRDPADRAERPSRKEISDHCSQHNQKRKHNHGETERDPETGFRLCDRGNSADIDESIAGNPVGKVKHVPLTAGIGKCLELSVGKIRLQIKSVGNPSIQKLSGLRIKGQIHTAVQIIEIRIQIKRTVFPFDILHAFLHLLFQCILRRSKNLLIAQGEQNRKSRAGQKCHEKGIQ